MSGIKVKLDDKKLFKMLRSLPDSIERKVLRQAMNPMLTPAFKASKRLCPRRTGSLKKALARKTKTYKRSMTIVGIIGAKSGAENPTQYMQPFNYVHLPEKGAKPHTITTTLNGKTYTYTHPGFKGTHFLAQAEASTRNERISIAKAKLAAGVVTEAKKLGL